MSDNINPPAQFSIFRRGVEQTRFGKFESSKDAMSALMCTGIAGHALSEFSVQISDDKQETNQ